MHLQRRLRTTNEAIWAKASANRAASTDKCDVFNGGCNPDHTLCTNIPGNRTCACVAGYEGDGIGNDGCADIDECNATDVGGSPPVSTRTARGPAPSTKGRESALTVTPTWPNTAFVHSECRINHGGCNAEARCVNAPGSRNCSCNDGFEGSGDGELG